jgi:hypothetical protein
MPSSNHWSRSRVVGATATACSSVQPALAAGLATFDVTGNGVRAVRLKRSFAGLYSSARSRARRSCLAIAVCALASLAIAAPASAGGNVTVTRIVDHFSVVNHYDGCAGFPGTTDSATGTYHLQYVELANGTLNVSYSETSWITKSQTIPRCHHESAKAPTPGHTT